MPVPGTVTPDAADPAAALARRDRAKLTAALAEAAALRYRVAELEHSPSRRALEPARRVVHAIRRLLRPAPQPAAPPPAVAPSRGLALIIDDTWPQPDRDAGSMEIVNLAVALRRLGFDVILAAAKQHDGEQPARDQLVAQGIRCLRPADAASVADFIERRGGDIDLCVLCRVFCGGAFLELAQRHCGRARLVFDAIDLNFLREERRARLTGDADLLALSGELRAREEHVIRGCDATMVVSELERTLLTETMPESLAVQMPLARALQPPVTPFAARRGIGFIGGFGHEPNADAVRYFLAEIWPLVRRGVPDCELTIVGADPPPDLQAQCHGPVRLLGHVPDLGPWFESLRLTVAPLRFGAEGQGQGRVQPGGRRTLRCHLRRERGDVADRGFGHRGGGHARSLRPGGGRRVYGCGTVGAAFPRRPGLRVPDLVARCLAGPPGSDAAATGVLT